MEHYKRNFERNYEVLRMGILTELMGLTRNTKINSVLALIALATSHIQYGTIKPLSWSQIKNNYFLSLILNQAETRRNCLL